jgi:transcriptional regulator with XRE-family HTH domain
MTATMHGPAVVRRRLGAALKRLRGELGLRLDVVARRLEISPSKLSRLETGQVAPKIRDVRDLLEIYEAPREMRERIMRWAGEAKEPGWWQPYSESLVNDLDMYISLEVEARRVLMFSVPISGLLQTEDYARMVLTGAVRGGTASDIDRLVEIRIRRQGVLDPSRDDAPPMELHVVLDESALHRSGEPDVLTEQLRQLLVRAAWPHVTVQVLPFAAGFTAVISTFAIFEPRDPGDATVVNIEGAGMDAYFDSAGDVARYRAMWTDVTAAALDPEASRGYVERMLSA